MSPETTIPEKRRIRRNRLWALLIGVGLALYPVHNSWLTKAVTSSDGQVTFFIPAFGAILWIVASLMFVNDNWKEITWGRKRVYIPLLIIVAAIGLSGITAHSLGGKFAPLLMGCALFSLYLVGRKLGKEMFLPLAAGAALASVGIIIYGFVNPGVATGGYVFDNNFDIATGFILLGAALFIHKWQWLLAILATVALLFSGAPEALFALGMLGIVVLLRKDWSRRLLAGAGAIAVLAVVVTGLGWADNLYSYTARTLSQEPMANYVTLDGVPQAESPIGIRVQVAKDALATLKPLGTGYNVTDFTVRTVHNVPLIIVQQLGWPGILAALCWLWVSIWCLRNTRWKYVWVAILALSLFDHYLWDQLGPIWWAAAGASVAATAKSDLIFRRQES